MKDEPRGMAFPFQIDEHTGGIAWASGDEKISDNVRLILGTRLGERPLMRDFGTRVHSLVHDPNDDVLSDLLLEEVRKGLVVWEPRILLLDAQTEQSEGSSSLRLKYSRTDDPQLSEIVVRLR